MTDTKWQEQYVSNLQTMIAAMDEHVTKEDVVRVLIELIADVRGTDIDREAQEKEPNVAINSAAEFAFIWNMATPEHRETIVAVLMARQDESLRCFTEDHDGLKEQLEAAHKRIAELVTAAQPKAESWDVKMLHPEDCARCEDCAEAAIQQAKTTGTRSSQWREMLPGATGEAYIGHSAEVKRSN